MASQDIIVKYRADVDDLTNQLRIVVERMDKLEQESKASAKGVDQLTKSVDKLDKELVSTGKSTKQATDNVKNFSKTANKEVGELTTRVQSFGSQIALGLAAAFSVSAITNFGKASIGAFLEAQENAEKLRFAIIELGNESEAVFDRLISQSERLQQTTIFSDDSVQQAQAMLATFGLTGAQIEELIPKLANFASVTKTDIVQAAQQVGAGLQGAGRELKKFGIDVSATATEMENLSAITEGFVQFQGAAAKETETLVGQLKQQENQVDELQEQVGEKLAPAWVKLKKAVFEATLVTIDYFTQGGNLATSLLNRLTDNLPTAFEEVTQKIDDQTKRLVDAGFDQTTARQNAIKDIRAEINERLALAVEKAKAAQADKDLDVFEKQRIANRLTGIRNELNAVIQIQDQYNELKAIQGELLKADELRIKSVEELNALLKINLADNRIVGQSNVRLINEEIALRKKLGEAALKAKAEADSKRLEIELKAWEEFKKQLEKEQDELLGIINSTEDKIKDQDLLFEFKIRFIASLEGEEQAFQVARDQLFKQFQDESIQADVTSNSVEEANAKKQKSYENYIASLESLVGDFAIFEEQKTEETARSNVEIWISENEEILNASVDLLNDLAAIYDQYQQNRIDQINEERDIKLAALDTEQQSIDDQLKKRRLSETEAQKLTEELTAKRLATEAAAAKKEQALKKKQFDIDKAAALIQIIINTAQAVTAALTIPPPAGTILAALNAAAGAAEGALVAGQPNPYKKGTKSAKEGLALVDEEGTEAIYRGRLTTLEKGDKVLTAPKTKTYGAVLDAMIDNTFDRYIMKTYVAPVLEKQVKQDKAVKQKSFEQNVIESIYINKAAGLTDYGLEKVWRKGNYVTNADDIGKSVARHLQKDIYR